MNQHNRIILICTLAGLAILAIQYLLPWLMTRLARYLDRKDPFGRDQLGFPQERQQKITGYSLHLTATYMDHGRKRRSWINFINPRRGLLILGSPGCGKTWFIIQPLIDQLTRKGCALFVFDFKYPNLSRYTYACFLQNRANYPANIQFYCINFSDLRRTHRCNVLDPVTLKWPSDALGVARTILLSLNRTWAHRQGDFFIESPINFLGAVIWYLKQYKEGIYCTLPHAIELAQLPYDQLFDLLGSVSELQAIVTTFREARDNKTHEMLDGQIASARIPLGRLSSPDLYYILSGNDLSLDINDLEAPKILCLGGSAARQEALAPVLSLFIDRLNRRLNQAGRYPCGMVCDEFATVRAYSMVELVATARSNNIIPILALQELNQLKTQYAESEAQALMNMAGNIVCGQVGGETAKWMSEKFPRIMEDRITTTQNEQGSSESRTRSWEHSMDQATIANLSSGEFVGVTADEPGAPQAYKVFHARIDPPQDPPTLPDLPLVHDVDDATIRQHFDQIRRDIVDLVNYELSHLPGSYGRLK